MALRAAGPQSLQAVKLYLITDTTPRAQPLERFLNDVIGAGVGMVQLREKRLGDRALLVCARRFAAACRSAGALFVLNDRLDLALASGADGVHLGQDDLPVEAARAIAGAGFIIGLSTHSREQLDAARGGAADYLGVGPIHETPTKPGRPAVGTELVRYAAAQATQPFFAIGGIDPLTLPPILAAGATRVSVLRWISNADDPARATRAIMDLM